MIEVKNIKIQLILVILFQSLGQMNPKLNVMMEGAVENMRNWAALDPTTGDQEEEACGKSA